MERGRMTEPLIEKLIELHKDWISRYCSILESRLVDGSVEWESIEQFGEADTCNFTKLLDSGRLHFDGEIALEAIQALHATLHEVASIMLSLIAIRAPTIEIRQHQEEFLRVSKQLQATLSSARVHSDSAGEGHQELPTNSSNDL